MQALLHSPYGVVLDFHSLEPVCSLVQEGVHVMECKAGPRPGSFNVEPSKQIFTFQNPPAFALVAPRHASHTRPLPAVQSWLPLRWRA